MRQSECIMNPNNAATDPPQTKSPRCVADNSLDGGGSVMARGGMGRKSTMGLLIVAVISIIVFTRVFTCLQKPVITRDGAYYVSLAEAYGVGPSDLLTSQGQEPVYPVVLHYAGEVVSRFGGAPHPQDWVKIGVLLGVVSSAMTAIGLWVLGSTIFNDIRVGLLGAFLVAVNPRLCSLSANVMTEPVFVMFLTLAVVFLVLALRNSTKWKLAGFGGLAGLAFTAALLTRKEAVLFLPVMVIFLCLPGLGLRATSRIAAGTVILVTITLLAGFYYCLGGRFFWLGDMATYWKNCLHLPSHGSTAVGLLPNAPVLAITYRDALDPYWEPFHRWLKMLTPPVAVAAVCYPFFCGYWKTSRRIWLILLLMAIYLAMTYSFGFQRNFIVGRYMVPAVLFSIPVAAAAIIGFVELLLRRRVTVSHRGRSALWLGVLAMVFVPSVVSVFSLKSDRDINTIRAAEWIEAHCPPSASVFTFDRRIPFYAGRQCVAFAPKQFGFEYGTYQDYRRCAFIVFFQCHGEEGFKNCFFDVVRENNLPLPRLVKSFSATADCPDAYQVEIYQL